MVAKQLIDIIYAAGDYGRVKMDSLIGPFHIFVLKIRFPTSLMKV